ncbi:MAG: tyrosine--tRNA ligase [Acidimicrobiia bacterium]
MTGILADLEARGLVHALTDRDELSARLEAGPTSLYYGCDPTADSLHVGNLIGLLILRRFQDAGHRPIALAGGATGMVGDPSGRSDERNLLDADTLRANVAAISAQIERILGPTEGWSLVDNAEWTADLRLLDFLRDVGKHVTVNQMVARESVRNRMESEQGISFTEFSYMLLQAHDYLWLHDHHGCALQIGGSDQWGNIVSGVDLIRRTRRTGVHGLCWPLLTAPDGSKLGKSAGARVWLDPARTSPYQFFQHWIQVPDHDVRRQLLWFTLLPVEEVEALVAAHEADPARRAAQRRLAHEATALVHGVDQAEAAAEAADVLFGAVSVTEASAGALELVAREVPSSAVTPADDLAGAGLDVVAALVRVGLVASNGEARRQIDQGGVTVNGERVEPGRHLGPDDLLHGRWALLRRGRKSWGVLDATPT